CSTGRQRLRAASSTISTRQGSRELCDLAAAHFLGPRDRCSRRRDTQGARNRSAGQQGIGRKYANVLCAALINVLRLVRLGSGGRANPSGLIIITPNGLFELRSSR